MTRAEALQCIKQSSFAVYQKQLTRLLKQSTLFDLVPAKGILAPGRTHFGGYPDIPKGYSWPTWDRTTHLQKHIRRIRAEYRGREHKGLALLEAELKAPVIALPFLGQIDLAALPEISPDSLLPAAGILHFFYVTGDSGVPGFDPDDRGAWRVIYSSEKPERSSKPPSGFSPPHVYPTCLVKGAHAWTLPSRWEDLKMPSNIELDEEFLSHFVFAETVRLRGYPLEIQSDSRTICQLATNGVWCGDDSWNEDPKLVTLSKQIDDWELLLQLGSDDTAGWDWCDAGSISFWIRRADLLSLKFDNVWLVLSGY